MRDPARIDQMLDLIREIWQRSPDLRLTQLLINAAGPSDPCAELYQLEDTKLMKKLEAFGKAHDLGR